MKNIIRKWMIRRWYKLDAINTYWYELSIRNLEKNYPYNGEIDWIAYKEHRHALDRRNAWWDLMAKFGWGNLTWNNYYGAPKHINPYKLNEIK